MTPIRIALAQINLTVGDLQGNGEKISAHIREAKRKGADFVLFPELATTGYPPEDLLLNRRFIAENRAALERLLPETEGIVAVVGFVDGEDPLYNAAAILHNGKIADVYHKVHLPNYGVFDEKRYFKEGKRYPVYTFRGIRFGVNICEDIWIPEGPIRYQSSIGRTRLILNINSSPFHSGKWSTREELLIQRSREHHVVIAYVNLVGGQDELVFDGHSLVTDPTGKILARGEEFEEELLCVDVDIEEDREIKPTEKKETYPGWSVHIVDIPTPSPSPPKAKLKRREVSPPEKMEETYHALTLGLKDYVRKNHFTHAVLGLSGGIDSALTAVIAVDALGKENVTTVSLPSRYTSEASRRDTQALIQNLGVDHMEIPIEACFKAYLRELEPHFKDLPPNVAEENIQARIRGNFLMALSNKFGWLVLSTGNKSEMSVGYATLYGDMAGGFAVLKDVPKTWVYRLGRYRNSLSSTPLIPEAIFTKAPSAELRPDQKDQDTLPPYETLDAIIQAYVEENKSSHEIIRDGWDAETVTRVIQMIDRNEYKRRQAPPGVKITPKAYGKDRRMPITNAYKS